MLYYRGVIEEMLGSATKHQEVRGRREIAP